MPSCPIHRGEKLRILKKSFIRQCLNLQALSGPAVTKRGITIPASPCLGCVTGKRIAAGEDFVPHRNTEWIGEDEVARLYGVPLTVDRPEKPVDPLAVARLALTIPWTTLFVEPKEIAMTENEQDGGPPAAQWKKEWDALWLEVPPDLLSEINIKQLRDFWQEPLIKGKRSKGTCPCCGRENAEQYAYGLCNCSAPNAKLVGTALLEILFAKGMRSRRRRGLDIKRQVEKKQVPAPPGPHPVIRRASEPLVGPPDSVSSSCFVVLPGYESLAQVLQEALNQAQAGKGVERHAKEVGEPFDRQKICEITRRVGLGYPLGQAIKKTEESLRLSLDAGVAEMLGAINYLSAAVICRREGM